MAKIEDYTKRPLRGKDESFYGENLKTVLYKNNFTSRVGDDDSNPPEGSPTVSIIQRYQSFTTGPYEAFYDLFFECDSTGPVNWVILGVNGVLEANETPGFISSTIHEPNEDLNSYGIGLKFNEVIAPGLYDITATLVTDNLIGDTVQLEVFYDAGVE